MQAKYPCKFMKRQSGYAGEVSEEWMDVQNFDRSKIAGRALPPFELDSAAYISAVQTPARSLLSITSLGRGVRPRRSMSLGSSPEVHVCSREYDERGGLSFLQVIRHSRRDWTADTFTATGSGERPSSCHCRLECRRS